MKFERINSNQIRCTLTVSDLANRRIRISELAYGNARTRALFKEMMDQASSELGFDIDDTPLMIEAVPMSGECLVLTITKIEDPEELDTRFSRFTPFSGDQFDDDDEDLEEGSPSDFMSVLKELGNHLFGQMGLGGEAAGTLPFYPAAGADAEARTDAEKQLKTFASEARIFEFEDLDTIQEMSRELPQDFACENSLFKNPDTGRYYLVLSSSKGKTGEFISANELCHEYGSSAGSGSSTVRYFKEHYAVIIRENALQVLRNI